MSERRRQVLFVCTGNTCRSPLAAAVAQAWLDRQGIAAVAVSAGIGAEDDAPASAGAREVAREAGLDLETHRAQLLTRPQVLAADLVLTMGSRHRDFIGVLAPEAGSRVHPLRDYASGGGDTRDIEDPFGGGRTVYRQTLRELQPLVERALQRWTEEGTDAGS